MSSLTTTPQVSTDKSAKNKSNKQGKGPKGRGNPKQQQSKDEAGLRRVSGKGRGKKSKMSDLIDSMNRLSSSMEPQDRPQRLNDPLLKRLQSMLDKLPLLENLEKRAEGVRNLTVFVATEFQSRPELVGSAASILLNPKSGLLKCLDVNPRHMANPSRQALQDEIAAALSTTALYCYGTMEISSFFQWAFQNLQTPPLDTRTVYSTREDCILLALVKILSPQAQLGLPLLHLPHVIEYVLAQLQSYLDGLKSVSLLPRVMEITEVLGKHYVTPFDAAFEDFIDIFVGWYIEVAHLADRDLRDSMLLQIDEFLARLSGYWLHHVSFVSVILRKLLKDVEGALDLQTFSQDEWNKSSSEWMIPATPFLPPVDLVKCFASLFSACFGAVYAPIMEHHQQLAQQVMEASADEVDFLIKSALSNAWRGLKQIPSTEFPDPSLQWIDVNHELFTLISAVIGPEYFTRYHDLAIRFYVVPLRLVNQSTAVCQHSIELFVEWMHLEWNQHPSIELLKDMFVPNSIFSEIRGPLIERVYAAACRGIPFVEEKHDLLDPLIGQCFVLNDKMDDIESFSLKLDDAVPTEWAKSLVKQEYDIPADPKSTLLSNVSHLALAAIGACEGDNLCTPLVCPRKVMWCLFSLCCGPKAKRISWSGVRNFIVRAMLEISMRRSFFIRGVGCSHYSSLQVKSLEPLPIIASTLLVEACSRDASFGMYMDGLMQALSTDPVEADAIKSLILKTPLPADPDCRLAFANAWHLLHSTNQTMLQGVTDVDERVSMAFIQSLTEVPWSSLKQNFKDDSKSEIHATTSTLNVQHFGLIVRHWGIPTTYRLTSEAISRIYVLSGGSPESKVLQSTDLQTYWLSCEAARFCVNARLKTPFGGPSQTLEAFDRHLHHLLHLLTTDTKDTPRLQALEFLQFLEALELQIQIASEGTALDVPPRPEQACSAFFAANKLVCSEWFCRIRPLATRVSALVGVVTPRTIYHGFKWLNLKDERDVALTDLSSAFVRLDEADALMGLAAWVKKNTVSERGPAPGSWIAVASLQADGRQEASIDLYRQLLKLPSYHGQPGPVLDFVVKSLAECYISLADYDGMKEFSSWINGQSCFTTGNFPHGAMNLIGDRLQAWSDCKSQDFHTPFPVSILGSTTTPDAVTRLRGIAEITLLEHDKGLDKLRMDLLQNLPLIASPSLYGEWSKILGFVSMIDSVLGKDVLVWPMVATETLAMQQRDNVMSNLQGDIVKMARKSGNFKLAHRVMSSMEGLELEKSKVLLASGQANAAMLPLLKSLHDENTSKPLRFLSRMSQAEIWKTLDQEHVMTALQAVHVPPNVLKDAFLQPNALAEYSLKMSVQENPNCPKSMYALGSHAYRRVGNIVDNLLDAIESGDFSNNLPGLKSSDGDLKLLAKYLLQEFGTGGEESIKIDEIITDRHDFVIKILDQAKQQHLELCKLAVKSYLQYLSMSNIVDTPRRQAKVDCNQLSATLRLLKLLVRHGSQLHAEFESLEKTIAPWLPIVPQLFARLDHPDQWIRGQITKLICKCAKSYPQHIVYHAVVGYNAALNSENDETIKTYNSVVNAIKDTSTGFAILENMQQMLDEMTRISILWEESWSNHLKQWESEVTNRIKRFMEELERMANITDEEERHRLIRDSYQAIMGPIVNQFRKLKTSTYGRNAETPHEAWFQQTFGSKLDEFLENIANPDYSNINGLLQDLKTIEKSFSITSTQRVIELSELSPFLANLKNSSVPVPGIHNDVVIQQITSPVLVLPTKTKPKRICIVGSDGETYMFLIKGSEDLHLDERMMQFVNVANRLLSRDEQCHNRELQARHYNVVPIGDKIGLIQWINHVTPVFKLYRYWKQFEWSQHNQGSFPNPQEYAFGKMVQALAPFNVNPMTTPRKAWPKDVVLKVFKDLQSETNSNVLYRELWTSSPTVVEWWSKIKKYSRSLATNNILGYIIGLGDRHLDNIMIDFANGEVIHIDYNICFDKGKTLRVPETVPFRLTKIFQQALGLTGVDGMYRIASEHVLRVARKNREILLTLLEAFIYDPLVDWAIDLQGNLERRLDNVEVGLSLLQSRFAEKKELVSDVLHLLHQGALGRLKRSLNHVMPVVNQRREMLKEYGEALKTIEDTDKWMGEKEMGMESQRIKALLEHQVTMDTNSHNSRITAFQKLEKLQDFGLDIVNTRNNLLSPSHVSVQTMLTPELSRLVMSVEQQFVKVMEQRMSIYKNLIDHLSFYYKLAKVNLEKLLGLDRCKIRIDLLEPLLYIATPEDFERAIQGLSKGMIDRDLVLKEHSYLKSLFDHWVTIHTKKSKQVVSVEDEEFDLQFSKPSLALAILLTFMSNMYDAFTAKSERTASQDSLFDLDVEIELDSNPVVGVDVVSALVMVGRLGLAHDLLKVNVLEGDEIGLLKNLVDVGKFTMGLWERCDMVVPGLSNTDMNGLTEIKEACHLILDVDETGLTSTSRTMLERMIAEWNGLDWPFGLKSVVERLNVIFDPLLESFSQLTEVLCRVTTGYVSTVLNDTLRVRISKCVLFFMQGLESCELNQEFRKEFSNLLEFIARVCVECYIQLFRLIVERHTLEEVDLTPMDRMHSWIDRKMDLGSFNEHDLNNGFIVLSRATHLQWQLNYQRNIQQALQMIDEQVVESRLKLFGHQLLYEHLLESNPSIRSRFLDSIQSDLAMLNKTDSEMAMLQRGYDEVEDEIRQFLQWNPSLIPTFDQGCIQRRNKFTLESRRSHTFFEICNNLIEFEGMRTIGNVDFGVLKNVQELQRCDKIGRFKQLHRQALEKVKDLQHKWNDLKLGNIKKNLVKPWLEAKQVYDLIEQVMGEVLPLAQQSLQSGNGISILDSRLSMVKGMVGEWDKISERLTNWIQGLIPFVAEIQSNEYLVLNPKNYHEFILEDGVEDAVLIVFFNQLPMVISSTSKSPSPYEKSSSQKVETVPKVQERNVYAVKVLSRVRSKLIGKDKDKKWTISEQVDNLISQATSDENLSVMYEGWMAWI